MVKPDAKVCLALVGIAVAAASVATVFLAVLQGAPHWEQLLLFIVAAVLGFASALLLWTLVARQLRVERAHSTKAILKGIASIEDAATRNIAALRDEVGAVRDQNVALDERQRKSLNVVRSEASATHARLDALHKLAERDAVSVAEVASESRDELKELRALARRVAEGVDAVDSRDRKILNLLRGEIRDSAARSDGVKQALAEGGTKAEKVAAAVDDASVTVRKMHNFLRRDGSIQIAVDRFTAAERRMLAAVESAGFDHADQIADLRATFDLGQEQESSARSRLESKVDAALEELRTELGSNFVGLGAEFDGLRDHVTGSTVSEPRLVEALSYKDEQLSADLDAKFRDFDEKFLNLKMLLDEMDASSESGSGDSAHKDGSIGGSASMSSAEITQACDSASRAVARAQTGRLERYIKRQSIDVIRQVEALMQLIPRVESQFRRYPPSGWWALPADTLLFLSDYMEQERPRRILEVGSGSSTVWTGTFAKQAGAELVSLEHDADYAKKTRALVHEFGLKEVVTVHHAPLRTVELEDGVFDWYEPNVVKEIEGPFDMLIVDGPPEATGSKARMPALPMLEHLLSEKCLVLLDDTHRTDEQEILKIWLEHFPGFEMLSGDLMRTGLIVRRDSV